MTKESIYGRSAFVNAAGAPFRSSPRSGPGRELSGRIFSSPCAKLPLMDLMAKKGVDGMTWKTCKEAFCVEMQQRFSRLAQSEGGNG